MYKVGNQVVFRQHRCACVGGGITEQIGSIIGFINDPFGGWWQISTATGVFYTRSDDVIRLNE